MGDRAGHVAPPAAAGIVQPDSARPLQIAAFWVVLVGVAIDIVLALTSTHVRDPVVMAIYRTYLIAAPALVGAFWWRRRPSSRIGSLLFLLAIGAAIIGWQSSDVPAMFTVGVFAEAPYLVLLFFLCLSFPEGRLPTEADRAVIGLLVAVLVATYVPWFVSGMDIRSGDPVLVCQPECPPNALVLFTLSEATRNALTVVGNALIALLALASLVLFLGRLRARPRPGRRALVALAATSLVLLPVVAIFVVATSALPPGEAERGIPGLAVMAAMILFPMGFALPLVQSELMAGMALRNLLEDLAGRPSTGRWRDEVARVLDDPQLRLGYWDEASRRYIEPDGRVLTPESARDRFWLPVARDDQPIAAVATHPVLATEPELGNAVAAATVAAVVNGQLEGTRRELVARAADAADSERMRVAREVHAGAQQRLAALRVHVTLVGERPGVASRERAFIDDLGSGVETTIAELREIIRTDPGRIISQGLGSALRAARRDSPVNVRIIDRGLHRHVPQTELAVYYCCLEAIQNTIKHAGPGASVTIRLTDADGGIAFSVADDGVGFDTATVVRGAGLQNIEERATALGGTVRITSAPGHGTVVAGLIPDDGTNARPTDFRPGGADRR